MVLHSRLSRIRKMPMLLVRFWLSYAALVALLLIIIGVPLGFGTYRLLSAEAYTTAENDLLSFSQSINTRLKEMDRIAVQLNDNQRLIPFFLASGGIFARDAVNELEKIRRSNDFIYDVAVYYTPDSLQGNGQGMFYAASGIYEPEMFFDDFYRYESWNLALFRKEVHSITHSTMRPLEKIWLNRRHPGNPPDARRVNPSVTRAPDIRRTSSGAGLRRPGRAAPGAVPRRNGRAGRPAADAAWRRRKSRG